MTPEHKRLEDHRRRKANWKKWGPYLSERAWGTVREDMGGDNPWESCPFDEAHKRVFRWGEDGLGGICDRFQFICFAFALWNGKDPILKERLFGLSSIEGNHGEDVKERYYYVDALPTSSYLKMIYHYPQVLFPYEKLREENARRGRDVPEYEIEETGVFDEERYFEVTIEYAKGGQEDISCRVTIENRGPEEAFLALLPQVWFRNTWQEGGDKPRLYKEEGHIHLEHPEIGDYFLYVEGDKRLLFCDNDQEGPHPKETFHKVVIEGAEAAAKEGTKGGALLQFLLGAGEKKEVLIRLSKAPLEAPFDKGIFEKKIKEADLFYQEVQNPKLPECLNKVQREAFAGMLFSKQFYYLDQSTWEKMPHSETRNEEWDHLTTFDILSMPDKWEYPYFCAWDSAFHCIPMVLIDPDYAKRQITLMTREWYMHPSGQFPAYEWAFSDVNPPVQAWALWRTYKIDGKMMGEHDRSFLEGNFHKLLLNFTWWINKKDEEGKNVFQGGFLGMDNISVFDRSKDLPTGGHIDQSDGSAWMSFYCISMMKIALHLAEEEPIYQDMATKFFEHFLRIAAAMSSCSSKHHPLWNEEDGFFYDLLHLPGDEIIPLKVRSLVGLLPLLAVETLDPDLFEAMPTFKRRVEWFLSKRPEVSGNITCLHEKGEKERRLMSIVTKERLLRILAYMLDEEEFLSPYGIRSVSKYHEKHPYVFTADGNSYKVKYVPGESDNEMFGGNSNWRGPIWMPINFLLIEALQRFHHYYGDDLKVEFPTGSGHFLNLWDVATELSKRLILLFPENGETPTLFHEYYHAETGQGLGASHQTGWTGLIAKLIQQSGPHLL